MVYKPITYFDEILHDGGKGGNYVLSGVRNHHMLHEIELRKLGEVLQTEKVEEIRQHSEHSAFMLIAEDTIYIQRPRGLHVCNEC